MQLESLIEKSSAKSLKSIGEKVLEGKRLSSEDAIRLFYEADLSYVGALAEWVNRKKNSNFAYFIVNRQINPTNICVYQCNFCSFGVTKSDPRAYEMSLEEVLRKVEETQRMGGK
ncbi:MAG: radical SAM protein, partial [Aquificota bacterium]